MIRFDHVTIAYDAPVVVDATFRVPEGELWLVAGPTGVGKSTLLGAVNGLVPRFTGGRLTGRVVVDGLDTAETPVREFAETVGRVAQDPRAGFVCDVVEEELAYGMEQLGIPPGVMRKRVEETLDLLGLARLRDRALADLSGGEQQRVAIGAALTALPRVLVLDEPTSALDPTGAEEVLAAVLRLVHDVGITVLMAEHRLERVVQYADGIVALRPDGAVSAGPPARALTDLTGVPPVVELARTQGWDPPPLSVREARARAGDLRRRLPAGPVRRTVEPGGPVLLEARRLFVRHGDHTAVRGIDVSLRAGEIVALMGRNGSGKSSLLWALHGAGSHEGRVRRPGVGLVPQTPTDLLYLSSVGAECDAADAAAHAAPGYCGRLLDTILPGVDRSRHPRDLSEGQRMGLVLAIQLTPAPPVVLLDEPTRGLDYAAKRHLRDVLVRLAEAGRSVVVATHDVEFAAFAADRVTVLADGEIVADGAVGDVLAGSPAFAPQVAKIVGPAWLTVDDVTEALAVTP